MNEDTRRTGKRFGVAWQFTLPILLWSVGASAQQPVADTQQEPPAALSIPYSDARLQEMAKPIVRIPDIRGGEGLFPPDAAKRVFGDQETELSLGAARAWPEQRFAWVASGVGYRPLYFDDTMLERHGHSRGPLLQPVVSASRFFLTFPLLPYKLQLEPPHTTLSALGHYRPGSGAPDVWQRSRFRWDAALMEGAAWTTGVLWVP